MASPVTHLIHKECFREERLIVCRDRETESLRQNGQNLPSVKRGKKVKPGCVATDHQQRAFQGA